MIDHHTSCRVPQRHLGGWHTLSHLPDTSVHFEEEQLSSSDTWSVREVCRLHSTSDIRLETKDGKKFDTSIWSRRRQSHSLISQLITDQSSWSSLWSLRNWIKSLKASRLYWDQYSLQMELKRVPTSHTFTSQPPERSLKTRRFKADVSFEEPFPRVSPLTAGTRGWGRRGQRWEKCASTLKCFSLPVG